MRTYALLAALALLPLVPSEALAVTAGVTAAVNQNARSIPPGGGIRTIVLGDNVIQDETIETDGAGLVQILLADGTTFTVGPNSSLVIDRFVYDPSANTAQVAASLGRGVFRFIGGRTSKTEGGLQLNTPVGTVGIRGGMADLNFSGTGGNIAQIDLLFGNEVTLNGPGGGDRLFQAGYSIIIGPNGQPSVIKTPPGSANIIQQALAGRPGANGGNSQQPSDDDVEESGVTENNSDTTPPQDIPPPDLDAIDLATPNPNDINQVAQNLSFEPGNKAFSSGLLYMDSLPAGTIGIPLNDRLGKTKILFNPEGAALGGQMVVSIPGGNYSEGEGYEVSLLSRIGIYPGAPAIDFEIDGDGIIGGSGTSSGITTSQSVFGTSYNPLDFVSWGEWNIVLGGVSIGSESGSATLKGNWISGDVITGAEYSAFDQYATSYLSGTVSYEGILRGFGQYAQQDQLFAPELGEGDFSLDWDFGTDTGTFHLSSFTTDSSEDFDHSMNASIGVSRTTMSGPLFGNESYTPISGNMEHLSVSGAFADNGNMPGEAVIGSFTGLDNFVYVDGDDEEHGMYFSVSGVFAGEALSNE